MLVSIITPTGCRPEQMKLCLKYMTRQSYQGDVEWIVVDDGEPHIDHLSTKKGWPIKLIYPIPRWTEGENTQRRNLLAGLEEAEGDRIIFIEDDDWYHPQYIERIMEHDEPLVGECINRYYHVGYRAWRRCGNQHHASLASTAIDRSLIPQLQNICNRPPGHIDLALWHLCGEVGKLCMNGNYIGIKGMAGRPGIGESHRAVSSWQPDRELETLKEWIGNDALEYEKYYG